MANRIKGITIEIGGDTSKLQKALSGVDKDLKSTQQQLRDVNRLLKLDPKNTELLTQKQRALQDAVSKTKERLEMLKEAEKQAAEQLKNGDIGQQEYDALQREIIDTEQKLKGLEDEQKKFGSVAQQQLKVVGEKFQAVGDKVKEVGDGMTKYVTGPLAAIGGASVAAFKSVDDGYDTMIAKTGATGEAAEELRTTLESIATSVPTDFNTAGAAIGEVATRFNVAGDDLEKLATQFVKFADLNNTDVVSSVDAVQSAMAAFGLSTDDAGAFLDTLNKAGQETGVSVDTLAQNMMTNATALKELGYSASDSAKFLAGLDKAGVDASTVVTGLRKALRNATKEGKPLDEALAGLEQTLMTGATDTEAYTAAMDLFGAKAGADLAAAIQEGRLSFEQLGTSIYDSVGNLDATFAETQDPLDQFKMTLNDLKVAGAEIGSSLLQVLAPALQKLAEIFRALKERWDSLTPAQQDMIVKIGLIVAAIGPLLMIIGSVISAIGTIIGVIGMITAPVLGVIAIIAAAIAIGVLLYKNWDTIKAKAIEIWNAIKDFFTKLWNGLKTTATNIFNGIKNSIIQRFQAIKNIGTSIWNAIKNYYTNLWNGLKNTATNVWNGIKNAISNITNGIKNTVTNVFNNIKNGITNIIGNIKTTIVNGFNNALSFISSLPSRAWQWGSDLIQSFINGIMNKFYAVVDTVSNIASTVADFIGFSEPDKGPLSNFHTFMPDMLKLMAQGIERNKGIVERAMNGLAEGMIVNGEANLNAGSLQNNPSMGGVMSALNQYLPYLAQHQDIYLDSGALVGGTAPAMNRALGQIQLRERRQ